jgi:hypothetical protein
MTISDARSSAGPNAATTAPKRHSFCHRVRGLSPFGGKATIVPARNGPSPVSVALTSAQRSSRRLQSSRLVSYPTEPVANDPHVDTLTYSFAVLDEGHDYAGAAPWKGQLAMFECELESGTLQARPTVHFSDVASAREALEPHLQSWEADAELDGNVRVEFWYESAHLIDLKPEPGLRFVGFEALVRGRGVPSATDHILHNAYPSPPIGVERETERARRFRERLRDFRNGRERVCVAAYWFASNIKRDFRPNARQTLNVSSKVLTELNKIGGVDDPTESRKAGGEKRSLTPDEIRFVRNALPALARRVAHIEGGHDPQNLPEITRSDLR